MGCKSVGCCKETVCDWRASRVPAAAVIPAPIVSMGNAAVKRSVVCVFLHVWIACVYGRHCLCDGRYATDGVHWIVGREVKCDDPDWTNRGEGGVHGRM